VGEGRKWGACLTTATLGSEGHLKLGSRQGANPKQLLLQGGLWLINSGSTTWNLTLHFIIT
jgi:hypothetical protein